MSKRTDVHAPSNIVPADYEFVAAMTRPDRCDGAGDFSELENQRIVLDHHMSNTGGKYSRHNHGGNCHVCGAHMIDFAVFYHDKSNAYIRTGFDCAAKLEADNPTLFRKIRDERHALEFAKAGKLKAQGVLREAGLLDDALALYKDGSFGSVLNEKLAELVLKFGKQERLITYPWNTAADIINKLITYGSLSEKQYKFLASLFEQIKQAESKFAAIKAEQESLPDAPVGRVVVKGEVVSVKGYEGMYGVQFKMVVKADEGYKVFVTVPSAISEVERGDKVEFVANLEQSNDDRSFAFGKRPSKAKIV